AYLLRDRDQVYGERFRQRMKGMRIGEVLTAPHSPWQNPFVERLIGSVRRECLEHVVVLGERHLRRILTAYFAYYHRTRPPPSPTDTTSAPPRTANRAAGAGRDHPDSRGRWATSSLHPPRGLSQPDELATPGGPD